MKDITKELNEALKLDEAIFYEMANIKKQRSGLSTDIWVDSAGTSRNVKHNIPRVKLVGNNYSVELSIEANPQVIAVPKGITESKVRRECKDAIDFIGKYHEIFLAYYNGKIDDVDLFDKLRELNAIK